MSTEEDDALIWKEESRKLLLDTVVFKVTERTSIAPDGSSGKYIVNEAKDWAIVIPVEGDYFLMVRQWRHGEQKLSIEFPGGVIEEGESFDKAAERELKEETGCSAGKLTCLGTMNPNPALFSNHVHVFCAEQLSFSGEQHLDSDEYVHYKKIKQTEVFDKMGTGEYCHALMAAALALYRQHYAI
jgi:8-oxo-dGTP pyrophosphatase MutT (NUDIX family)